jgi:hypothetical protein
VKDAREKIRQINCVENDVKVKDLMADTIRD